MIQTKVKHPIEDLTATVRHLAQEQHVGGGLQLAHSLSKLLNTKRKLLQSGTVFVNAPF